jgi:hypothetical protein
MLHIRGSVVLPTPGYEVWLEPASPQGFNDRMLEMHLRDRAPSSPVTQVLTPAEVEYSEQTDHEYDEINIRELGLLLQVEHPE